MYVYVYIGKLSSLTSTAEYWRYIYSHYLVKPWWT